MSGWSFLMLVLCLISAPEKHDRAAPWIAWAIVVIVIAVTGLIEHQGWPG